jgi:hypothetical protein
LTGFEDFNNPQHGFPGPFGPLDAGLLGGACNMHGVTPEELHQRQVVACEAKEGRIVQQMQALRAGSHLPPEVQAQNMRLGPMGAQQSLARLGIPQDSAAHQLGMAEALRGQALGMMGAPTQEQPKANLLNDEPAQAAIKRLAPCLPSGWGAFTDPRGDWITVRHHDKQTDFQVAPAEIDQALAKRYGDQALARLMRGRAWRSLVRHRPAEPKHRRAAFGPVNWIAAYLALASTLWALGGLF